MLAQRTLRLMMIVAGIWLAEAAATRGQSPDCPAWEQKHPANAPSPRFGHAMAYDSARRVTVLFGGRFSNGADHYFGDTWEWDGLTWSLRSTVGPPARYRTAMAHDDSRGVVVLFGGVNGAFYGDTWEWDGVAWARRSQSGPSPRYDHAMVYDSHRGVTVLFGGFFRVREGETWEWDGSTWSLRSNTGPAPRRYHAMAYDAERHVTVLNGGSTGPEAPSGPAETWEWDGSLWQRRTRGVPGFRAGHAMAYDDTRGVTLLFSGFWDTQTWAWDGTTWALLSDIGPPSRSHAGMAYDRARRVTVLFGGLHGSLDPPGNDTWELPSCPVDTDGDGVPDLDDECDISDLRSTIIIDGCDSGVANHLFDNGCTMADGIAACAEEAGNHGAFVGCVAELTNTWVRDEIITSRDKGPAQRCAAHANLPEQSEDKARPMKGASISPVEALSRP